MLGWYEKWRTLFVVLNVNNTIQHTFPDPEPKISTLVFVPREKIKSGLHYDQDARREESRKMTRGHLHGKMHSGKTKKRNKRNDSQKKYYTLTKKSVQNHKKSLSQTNQAKKSPTKNWEQITSIHKNKSCLPQENSKLNTYLNTYFAKNPVVSKHGWFLPNEPCFLPNELDFRNKTNHASSSTSADRPTASSHVKIRKSELQTNRQVKT